MPASVSPANRFGLDYRQEARRLGPPPAPITDIHSHIGGLKASRIYDEVRKVFGVHTVYSMTQITQAAPVRDNLGASIRFIAVPSWGDPDRSRMQRAGYLEVIEQFHARFNARILKIWSSPRLREIVPDGATDLWEVDSPWRVKVCELGQRLGMMYMIHIADPDTWFAAKYRDTAKFGTKRSQYESFERMLDRFTSPWIGAHMGGWPEDLGFLDGMLTRHDNLYLDTSATKWMIRELSRHPRDELAAFLYKWTGRVLFGSDVVVTDDHLQPAKATTSPMSDLADSPESAFELYASRYYALRTFFETDYDGESPISDPDLAMVEPEKYNAASAPRLVGAHLPPALLRMLYSGAAEALVGGWERDHP